MDGLASTRALKREIESNNPILVPLSQQNWNSSSLPSQPTTETATLISLRRDQNLKWSEITNILNRQRLEAGEPATLSESAVYSRFVLHTTCSAQPVGETGFNAKDYVHLRYPGRYVEGRGEGGMGVNVSVSRAGRKRIKDYENAKELKANMRQVVSAEEARGELKTVEKTEELVEAVAKVERNFWRTVAGEMERKTTRMYEPEELANRYHDI